ncbi:hypothetical protein ACN08X_07090 [Rothia sp. P6271]|uniref:hypothetical protein n=1 Tax=Rothia sp. P6271 TaxID=3402659 RepID=UPI003AC34EE0
MGASLVPLLLLTGCSSEQPDSKSESSSQKQHETSTDSSAAASTSQNPTTPAHQDASARSTQQPASTEQKHKEPEQKLEENYAGAESLQNSKEVQPSEEHVAETEKLYTSYQNVLSNIGTVAPTEPAEEDSARSGEDSAPATTVTLDQATEEKITSVATGSAAESFIAAAEEFANNQWTQEGTAKVVGTPKIADGTYNDQPAKILQVCLDSSQVKVKNAAGDVINNTSAPERSLNIFTLIQDNGQWKIASHDFPNNPDC